jgi:hypothetical protein
MILKLRVGYQTYYAKFTHWESFVKAENSIVL